MTDFKQIALKWQKIWDEKKAFKVEANSSKEKFYCLEMFPYPSGSGLHMGHVRNYAIGDAFARYKRMRGFNVLYPMGYDAFGLPAENAAIKNGIDPKKWTESNMQVMKGQQKLLGLSYDWDREIATCRDDYYKWNQWIFLKLYEKGLVYRKKATVNWDPVDKTVLANEQVKDGKGWRSGAVVEEKEIEQWFFKITNYADELLEDLKKLEQWPHRVKVMQENWIGKSNGVEIKFKIVDKDGKELDEVHTFTTRPDTIFGVTYLVLSPENPLVKKLVAGTKEEKEVIAYCEKAKKKKTIDRQDAEKEKSGVFTGRYIINPVNNEKCPLFVADYVLMGYGTGAVMAVPAHDQRDFEFATKYSLPIKVVIQPKESPIDAEQMTQAYIEPGIMVNSGEFNGKNSKEVLETIGNWFEGHKWGKREVNYKIRDWLISRQRYWGTPIPILYDENNNPIPVKESDLPVTLPDDVKFGVGNPLETSKSFVSVTIDGKKYRRETDTMDTFVDSSWYFLRYASPNFDSAPFDKKEANYWLPVDQYIGGIEHAVLHLLYARFFTKALRDIGLIKFDEPFLSLLCQGMVTKDGAKMSKSIGNVVDPNEIIDKFGPDTARFFILFVSFPEKELDWSDEGVEGSFRAVNKILNLSQISPIRKNETEYDKFIQSKMHSTIKKVTEFTEEMKFSLALGAINDFANILTKYSKDANAKLYNECIKTLALLSTPFIPHTAEEIWEKLGNKDLISLQTWPSFNDEKIDHHAERFQEFIHETLSDFENILKLAKVEKPKSVKFIQSDNWKYEFMHLVQEEAKKTRDVRAVLGTILNESDMKPHGQDISKLVPKILKDNSKLNMVIIESKKEKLALDQVKKIIETEYGSEVIIENANDSKESKAKASMPNKPSIVVA